mmetsp:Transcript_87740/g.246534  ORF Transcript_87740/g.246534 Transcript_87740/m.246534 type:complete len:320 (+) Transcript_87740:1231-2190(+)
MDFPLPVHENQSLKAENLVLPPLLEHEELAVEFVVYGLAMPHSDEEAEHVRPVARGELSLHIVQHEIAPPSPPRDELVQSSGLVDVLPQVGLEVGTPRRQAVDVQRQAFVLDPENRILVTPSLLRLLKHLDLLLGGGERLLRLLELGFQIFHLLLQHLLVLFELLHLVLQGLYLVVAAVDIAVVVVVGPLAALPVSPDLRAIRVFCTLARLFLLGPVYACPRVGLLGGEFGFPRPHRPSAVCAFDASWDGQRLGIQAVWCILQFGVEAPQLLRVLHSHIRLRGGRRHTGLGTGCRRPRAAADRGPARSDSQQTPDAWPP